MVWLPIPRRAKKAVIRQFLALPPLRWPKAAAAAGIRRKGKMVVPAAAHQRGALLLQPEDKERQGKALPAALERKTSLAAAAAVPRKQVKLPLVQIKQVRVAMAFPR